MLKINDCSVHDLIFVEEDGKCQFPVTGPLYGLEVDHGLGGILWPSCPVYWEGSFPGLLKISLVGHSMCCYWTRPCEQQKSLDCTCLTSLLVQENVPSCYFFSYTELHHYNYGFQMELYTIIIVCLSHTRDNVRDNTFWSRQCRKQYS